MGTYSEVFNNLKDFRAALQRPANAVFADRPKYSRAEVKTRRGRDFRYYGTLTYGEADRLMAGGYTPAITHIAGIMADNATGEVTRRRRVYSQAGGRVVVSRYLNDSPTPFARRMRRHTTARVLSVLINLSIPCTVLAADIQDAAALALSALSALEQNGVRLNIYAGDVTCDPDGARKPANAYYMALAVKIKDAGEALSIGAVAYPLAHPSMLRRHMLAWTETTPAPGMPDTYARNYGTPCTDPEIIRAAYQGKIGADVAIVSLHNCLHKSPREVAEYVQRCIDEAAK